MSSPQPPDEHKLDWTQLRARLETMSTARVEHQPLSAAETQRILESRAARLAELPPHTPAADELLELLTFRFGSDLFSIETQYVREVIRPHDLTVVPGVPAFIVGVTNLRGEVLAIVNVRHFFGRHPPPRYDQGWVIVLGEHRAEFGILADNVCEVSIRGREEILEVPSSVPDAGRRFLKGVVADAMLVIDGTLLLQDSRLYVDQED